MHLNQSQRLERLQGRRSGFGLRHPLHPERCVGECTGSGVDCRSEGGPDGGDESFSFQAVRAGTQRASRSGSERRGRIGGGTWRLPS